MTTAYYNEFDPQKAAWLRELIKADAITPGEVDERSIHDVRPDDLRGFSRCHFFAGIGIWDYALNLAGWGDHPAWTGSCPCPSFSAAGKGEGFDDPRHLWPDWYRLIRECKPSRIIGEQVDAAIGHGWLDLVHADLETEAYSVGAAVLGACSVGAPHRRQRLYFVAESAEARRAAVGKHGSGRALLPARSEQRRGVDELAISAGERHDWRRASGARHQPGAVEQPERFRDAGVMGEPNGERCDGQQICLRSGESQQRDAETSGASGLGELGNYQDRGLGERGDATLARDCGYADGTERSCRVGNSGSARLARRSRQSRNDGQEFSTAERAISPACLMADSDGRVSEDGHLQRSGEYGFVAPDSGAAPSGRPGPTNGHWRDADWLRCRDGRWRPVRPGSFPLAHGATARVVRLRGYGDGIVAQVAAEFVTAYLEATR